LPFKGKDGFFKSVGEIILKDKNPFTPPIIDPKYLHHPHDVKLLTEGLFPAHEHILHTAWLTSRIKMCIFFALVAIKLTIKNLDESKTKDDEGAQSQSQTHRCTVPRL
jgi:hypothetical protein